MNLWREHGGVVGIVVVASLAFAGLAALIAYGERSSARAQAEWRSSWSENVKRGLPARVVVTEAWQMPVLAGLGYLPSERFTYSGWSGPCGYYELPESPKPKAESHPTSASSMIGKP